MEISKLKSPPVKAQFPCGDGVINLELNADVPTPNFLRMAREVARKAEGVTEGDIAEDAEFAVNILSSLIDGWDVTDNSVAVPPSRDFLSTQPLPFLMDLLAFSMEAVFPKKPQTGGTPANPTTSVTTGASSSQVVERVESPTM